MPEYNLLRLCVATVFTAVRLAKADGTTLEKRDAVSDGTAAAENLLTQLGFVHPDTVLQPA